MKRCFSCGKTQENSEKPLREYSGEYYCIFCLDEDGKPRNPNPVRKSIKSFWRERNSQEQDSAQHSGCIDPM
jgi:hypothetical protein